MTDRYATMYICTFFRLQSDVELRRSSVLPTSVLNNSVDKSCKSYNILKSHTGFDSQTLSLTLIYLYFI